MFAHRFFAARFYAPRYFAGGATDEETEPLPNVGTGGLSFRASDIDLLRRRNIQMQNDEIVALFVGID